MTGLIVRPRGLSAVSDSTGTIIKIFLFSLYLPAGRQVLNIPSACALHLSAVSAQAGADRSILSKKWDFYTIQLDKHQ
ncbi:MAG: hypothetical protein JRI41_10660 [Deltaproteobacteria bacterium]|nr:hypothetical protein [Deltaproteobacteria bacterium]